MNSDTVVTRAHVRTDVADALVEALATTGNITDPFHQAAAVAEYLYNRGVILERSSVSLLRTAYTGLLAILVLGVLLLW